MKWQDEKNRYLKFTGNNCKNPWLNQDNPLTENHHGIKYDEIESTVDDRDFYYLLSTKISQVSRPVKVLAL